LFKAKPADSGKPGIWLEFATRGNARPFFVNVGHFILAFSMSQTKNVLVFLLIASAMVSLTGCNEPAARDWYTIQQFEKEHPYFVGYEVVGKPEFEGPYKLVQGIYANERRESNTYFHREVEFDGKVWEFRDDKGAGHGFRVLSVENQKGERGPIWLRTFAKQDSMNERWKKGEVGSKTQPPAKKGDKKEEKEAEKADEKEKEKE
jgi:hypothetical protein